jgi:predicted metal-dependent phosphotriesterase family hydrolase
MASIQTAMTVLGPVPADELGFTHSHEHLVAHPPAALLERDPDLDLGDPVAVLEDLEAFRRAGGGTVVEMTTVDYGRDPAALAGLARRSGVHIVAATGFNRDKYCAEYCEGVDPGLLAERQVQDLTVGCGPEGARAGVIKVATGLDGASAPERAAIRAAGLAHRATGAPVFTHTEAGTFSREQLELLGAEGVEPTAVSLGHMDRNPDLELHTELAAAGAFLSYDHVPKPKYATEDVAIELILGLHERGLAGQVLVGGDFARRSLFRGYGGEPGLGYLAEVFAPRLRAAAGRCGADGEQLVEAVFHHNPRRALAWRSALIRG